MTPEMLLRTPLLTEDGVKLLERLREHPDAPRFNYITGDRLRQEDLGALGLFRDALHTHRGPRAAGPPPPAILQRVASWRRRVPFVAARIPEGLNVEKDWLAIPTSSRADLAQLERTKRDDPALIHELVFHPNATLNSTWQPWDGILG